MGRIPEQIVDEVLERSDMLQVIGEYVQIKKAGTNYKGLCPFHAEKTPSFNVNPHKGFFKCFGCGEGGGLFNFLMKMEGWSFPETVRHLAARVGVTIEEEEDDEEARRKALEKKSIFEAMKVAQKFYERQLWEGEAPEARAYLESRGVHEETARLFGLGYAPEGWSSLLDHAGRKGLKGPLLERAGLVIPGGRGHYDRFRDRIMFPVFDVWGNVVAFSGRIIKENPDKKGAKYINSPETPVYTKGKELFGLYSTKTSVRKQGAVLMVEGNFDVVTLHALGVTQAVAPLGTALTERQVRLMARFCRKAYVAFDADKAGLAATLKALPAFMAHAIDARVVELPEGDDPDSYVRREGKSELIARMDKARPIVAWAIDQIIDGKLGLSIEERVKALTEAGKLLGHVSDQVTWNHYANEIARRLDIEPRQIRAYLKRPERLLGAKPAPARPERSAPVETTGGEINDPRQGFDSSTEDGAAVEVTPSRAPAPLPDLEARCLQILSDSSEKLVEFVDNGCCPLLTDERLVFLIERVYEQHTQREAGTEYVLTADRLADELGDRDFFEQVSALLARERAYDEDTAEQSYFDIVTRMQMAWWKGEYARLIGEIQSGKGDEVALTREMSELIAMRRELDVRLQKKIMEAEEKGTHKKRQTLEEFEKRLHAGPSSV